MQFPDTNKTISTIINKISFLMFGNFIKQGTYFRAVISDLSTMCSICPWHQMNAFSLKHLIQLFNQYRQHCTQSPEIKRTSWQIFNQIYIVTLSLLYVNEQCVFFPHVTCTQISRFIYLHLCIPAHALDSNEPSVLWALKFLKLFGKRERHSSFSLFSLVMQHWFLQKITPLL